MKEATELEFLEWFYRHADFGPADGDVKDMLKRNFEAETGLRVPKSYRSEDE